VSSGSQPKDRLNLLRTAGGDSGAEIVRKKRERVYEQIVEQIQQLIRDKVLSPGDQLLPERQLAEKLGVSRAALREALTVLVSRGLIEITPGGGAYVRESSIEDLVDPLAAVMLKERQSIYDLLEARSILEIGAVRLAAQRGDLTDVYQIQQAALEMNDNMRRGQPADEADVNFHQSIVQASHNPVLVNMMAMIVGVMKEVYAPSRHKLLEDLEKLEVYERQNLDIVAAIRSGDPEAAAALLFEHLSMASEELRRLENAGQGQGGAETSSPKEAPSGGEARPSGQAS
jgi:GntR family transcriptional regulator, transcriptional repressor for pyruvate dehydrogenase complex